MENHAVGTVMAFGDMMLIGMLLAVIVGFIAIVLTVRAATKELHEHNAYHRAHIYAIIATRIYSNESMNCFGASLEYVMDAIKDHPDARDIAEAELCRARNNNSVRDGKEEIP